MLNNSKLQAFLALAPMGFVVLFMLLFLLTFLGVFIGNPDSVFPGEEPNFGNSKSFIVFPILFGVAIFFYLITLFVSWVYFVLHAAKNPNLEEGNMRLIWILLLIFASGIGALAYWAVEIAGKNPRPVV